MSLTSLNSGLILPVDGNIWRCDSINIYFSLGGCSASSRSSFHCGSSQRGTTITPLPAEEVYIPNLSLPSVYRHLMVWCHCGTYPFSIFQIVSCWDTCSGIFRELEWLMWCPFFFSGTLYNGSEYPSDYLEVFISKNRTPSWHITHPQALSYPCQTPPRILLHCNGQTIVALQSAQLGSYLETRGQSPFLQTFSISTNLVLEPFLLGLNIAPVLPDEARE